MAVRKLRDLGDGSAGVTLPKGDLRLEGLIEGGEVSEEYVEVNRVEDGKWEVERVGDLSS